MLLLWSSDVCWCCREGLSAFSWTALISCLVNSLSHAHMICDWNNTWSWSVMSGPWMRQLEACAKLNPSFQVSSCSCSLLTFLLSLENQNECHLTNSRMPYIATSFREHGSRMFWISLFCLSQLTSLLDEAEYSSSLNKVKSRSSHFHLHRGLVRTCYTLVTSKQTLSFLSVAIATQPSVLRDFNRLCTGAAQRRENKLFSCSSFCKTQRLQ